MHFLLVVMAQAVKNLPANAEDIHETQVRSLYSCLENPMDRGVWQATVHRVAKNQTQLKQLSTQS